VNLRGDFLVIGSGIAALRAAVDLADAGDVLILTKAEAGEGNTGYAQGGIAAALGAGDDPSRHAADTIAAGDGLCDEAAVAVLVEDGRRYVRELIEWGARFDRAGDGTLALAREGAHSVSRVLHARDATGREIAATLWRRVSKLARVRTQQHALVTSAIVRDGRCDGVRFFDQSGAAHEASARAVLLATGGAGQVYSETTNPGVATGDGITIAYDAGAHVSDLEFIQFHPTALNVIGQPRFLISEALRGEGGRLINQAGDAFMARYEAAGDLASRDRVARAIVREEERTGGPVCLSLAHLPGDFVHRRFPLISEACRRAGLDLARDPIPVGPAAHYVMGGITTDLWGRTSVPGLFAAGEVACTGVHGANRLASNSLLEGLVFGARAGQAMARWLSGADQWPEARRPGLPDSRHELRLDAGSSFHAPGSHDSESIPALMWRHVGLFRDRRGLEHALGSLEPAWRDASDASGGESGLDVARWRAFSLLTVARLIARAALRREESRGSHYRSDFPARDDIHWRRHAGETKQRG
jgi:L-aspartate oxidase